MTISEGHPAVSNAYFQTPMDRLMHSLVTMAEFKPDAGKPSYAARADFQDRFKAALADKPASALHVTIKFASYALRNKAHADISPMLAEAAAGQLDAYAERDRPGAADFARRLAKLTEAQPGSELHKAMVEKRDAFAARPGTAPTPANASARLDCILPVIRQVSWGINPPGA